MLELKVMACGHVSGALYTTEEGAKIPVCPVCIKINPKGAKEIVSLKGRAARCHVCKNWQPSTPTLFDFKYDATSEFDSFYDGCMGWDNAW